MGSKEGNVPVPTLPLEYKTKLEYVAVGLILGILVLRNFRVKTWERVMWWFSLLLFLALFLADIVWNDVIIGHKVSSKKEYCAGASYAS